jgi:ubiquinone/menaquinone biosynthesis C-methylase UbiE
MMTVGAAERETIAEFDRSYSRARSPVIQTIERSVCGCDYGGTSWTTREEAERILEELALTPGKAYLEVGAGSGWPSLYLSKLSGCSTVLIDLPLEGLRAASERAQRDGLSRRCLVLQADGASLPLRDTSFDAISHSDVLCCLEDKAGVLRECRRTIRGGGRMVFTVICTAPDLSAQQYADAIAAGPPFIEAETDYETMLTQTGWRVASRADLTGTFVASARRLVREREAHADELAELMGSTEYADMMAQTRWKLPALEARFLLRAMFVVVPA